MGTEQFKLKWNNHTNHLVGVFDNLLQSESLVDVTLCCEGQSLRAHKLVLSACSRYFKTLFQEHAEAHPIVILKDVKFAELRSIVQFMYKGEVEVDQHDIESLISTAESLEIRGLAGSRSTVSGLHFPPAPPPPPRDLPASRADLAGVTCPDPAAERKRQRSDLDAGGGGGEPPSAAPAPGAGRGEGGAAAPASNGEEGSVIKRPKIEMDSGEDNSGDGLDSAMEDASHLCQPELLSEPPAHDPQLQAALGSGQLGPPQGIGMTPVQREAMQQQMQMLQEYMMPMLSNLSMGMTMPNPGVDVISNTQPTSKAGMSGLSCNVCAMIMPDLPTLEQHLRIHEEDKPYKCLQCGQRYKYQSAYQRHIDMNHTARLPQEKPYRCEVCGQFFKYLKSFHKHRANHTAIDRILNVPVDDVMTGMPGAPPPGEFPLPGALPGQQMMPGMAPAAQMSMMGRPCLSAETMQAAFGQQPPPQPPTLTGNRNLTMEEREEPNSVTITAIKTERLETPPPGQAPPPGQVPPEPQVTTEASGQTADGSDANPPPDSPDAGGDPLSGDLGEDSQLSLQDASSSGEPGGSSGDPARSWICPFCLKGFRGKENLKLHIRTHTGEKPYECGMCDKRFVGKSDLNRHLRVHTGEKPYECNICYRRFARGDYLTKHMVTHGQGGTPPPGDPPIGGSTDPTAGGSTDQPTGGSSDSLVPPSPENGSTVAEEAPS